LEAEILRRTSIRRKVVFATVAAALMLGGITAWFTLAHFKSRELARQLEEAVAQRKVRTTAELLDDLTERKNSTLLVADAAGKF
jgi:hypothetical protein